MGYVIVMEPCVVCRATFTFHPNKVPSIRVRGVRRPICESCVHQVNRARENRGLPPFPILPGAYEAADEADIDWGDE